MKETVYECTEIKPDNEDIVPKKKNLFSGMMKYIAGGLLLAEIGRASCRERV